MKDIQQEGKQLRAKYLDARGMASPLGYLRVGIVVPKYGETSVRRNRLKRQIRELTRLLLLPENTSCNLVIRGRKNLYSGSFQEIRRDVELIKEMLIKQYWIDQR